MSGDHPMPPDVVPGMGDARGVEHVSVGRVSSPRRFRALQASTVRARCGPLRASWSAHNASVCVAYAVPTSVGNAVARNTIRRRLRSLLEASAAQLPPGDLLVRVSGPSDRCTWSELQSAVAGLVADIGRRAGPVIIARSSGARARS